MKTKELNAKVFPYILGAIDADHYEVKAETDKEKLQFLFNTFVSEAYTPDKQRYHKRNIYQGFESWIMGLPSSFNIDFEYCKIREIAVKWGSLPENSTEKQQEKITDNWFNFITNKTFQLFKKHKIDMNY